MIKWMCYVLRHILKYGNKLASTSNHLWKCFGIGQQHDIDSLVQEIRLIC